MAADKIWPGGSGASQLPTSALLGWTETPGNNAIRTETETGPAKVRRRSTSAPTTFTLSFILTEARATALIDFFTNDETGGGVSSGALSFNGLPHPRTGSSAVVWRFLEPPAITLISRDIYDAKLKLELLPE